MKRKLQAHPGPRLDEEALAFGANREALRRKYADLDLRELFTLANETSVLATKLLALAWERMRSEPTGN